MNQEELINRCREERETIFVKYDQGREGTNNIDPWEDPGYEVYHSTDRYGFIHDQRLPVKVNYSRDHNVKIEMERVKKWIKMLQKWEMGNSSKMETRIYKGIPNSLRSQVWVKLLNIQEIKMKNTGVYQRMLTTARQWSTDVRQIDSDVNRQFRDHVNYRERYSIKQKSLFNVLCAYGMYNMEVGYCQGMSGIAGVLLMYMDEEETFWAIHVLLTNEKFSMHGYFMEGFPKLLRYIDHHNKILTTLLPKLKKHLDRHGVDAILYSLKWFFVCFIERLPFSLCLRVWDIYLLEGERTLTSMSFTILKLHKKTIMGLKDMDKIVEFLQVKLFRDFGYSDDDAVAALHLNSRDLKKYRLEWAGPCLPSELPKKPFGKFVQPDIQTQTGVRAKEFNELELNSAKAVQEKASVVPRVKKVNDDQTTSQCDTPSASRQENSLEGAGSRRSLADTSVTSTADLSILNSLDTRSNISEGSGCAGSCTSAYQLTPRRSLEDVSCTIKSVQDNIIQLNSSYGGQRKSEETLKDEAGVFLNNTIVNGKDSSYKSNTAYMQTSKHLHSSALDDLYSDSPRNSTPNLSPIEGPRRKFDTSSMCGEQNSYSLHNQSSAGRGSSLSNDHYQISECNDVIRIKVSYDDEQSRTPYNKDENVIILEIPMEDPPTPVIEGGVIKFE